VDNWRWQDVPFYLRTGKALAEGKLDGLLQEIEEQVEAVRRSAVDEPFPDSLSEDTSEFREQSSIERARLDA